MPITIEPAARAAMAPKSPNHETPRRSIGMPPILPNTPSAIPTRRRTAFLPFSITARIASAAATPGGQEPSAGNISEPKHLYMIVESITVASVTPTSIGNMRSGLPMMTGIPIGRIMQFAAENVAAEMDVCRRFCLWTLRYFLKIPIGIREKRIANSAPMIDVLAVTPVRTISSIPMIAPPRPSGMQSSRTSGSHAFGCFSAVICC